MFRDWSIRKLPIVIGPIDHSFVSVRDSPFPQHTVYCIYGTRLRYIRFLVLQLVV